MEFKKKISEPLLGQDDNDLQKEGGDQKFVDKCTLIHQLVKDPIHFAANKEDFGNTEVKYGAENLKKLIEQMKEQSKDIQ